MSFSGKVVLITGASSGIGADAARHLAKLGASVSIVGRNAECLNEVANEIVKANSPKPLAIVADVTKDSERIINETVTHFGRLDVLVNNAGVYGADNVLNFDVDMFDHFVDTNIKSVIVLTKLAVPHLEETKGNVINVSSVSGLKAYSSLMSYCITKAGLNQFTKCAAIKLARKGIRVNSINPGMVRTQLFKSVGLNESNSDQFFEDRAKDYLVGRIGEVSDTSSAIAYLASESFVNGVSFVIDGGLMCS